MKDILVPVSPGEMLDKITILEIKSERIDDPIKVANVRHELELLTTVWSKAVADDSTISALKARMKSINEELWVIEDDIRDQEKAKDFGSRFVELARAVYVTNDQRAAAKKELNLYLGSDIVEEKSYQDYQ
ncbi:MAG: DUF6165 family protein [Xanthomonadales bacterium]|nr:DUF6165 family protein [Xanthomonadales bacterium]